ncbi:MAG: hypothetical protein U0703_23195 [Anaerolineae bacterium]
MLRRCARAVSDLQLPRNRGLLPNTAAAKRMESAPYLARDYLWRLGNVLTPLAAGAQLLLIPGMAAYLAFLPRARRSILLALPLIWAAALILLYAATLPLDIQHGATSSRRCSARSRRA